jgi:hypothetical protein
MCIAIQTLQFDAPEINPSIAISGAPFAVLIGAVDIAATRPGDPELVRGEECKRRATFDNVICFSYL